MGFDSFQYDYIAPQSEPDLQGLQRELMFKLIAARLRRHITQVVLAEMVGTSQHIISRAESGKYNPSLNTLLKMCWALDVRLTLVE